jgi:hypothetical protein
MTVPGDDEELLEIEDAAACQYSYFCTSKASKMSVPGDEEELLKIKDAAA